MKRVASAFSLSALVLVAGCRSIGPTTVARDRLDYAAAISKSWKRQMLLNTVMTRYADAPVFLDITSIIGQYSLEGSLTLGASWSDGANGDMQSVTGRGRYVDRPTITYQPLTGKQFTKNMMTPIPPESILQLIQSGWAADTIFLMVVHSINGIPNRSGSALRPNPGDPEFLELIQRIRRVQASGALGMRVVEKEDRQSLVLFFSRAKGAAESIRDDSARIRELLGLPLEIMEIDVVYGALPQSDHEIAILTRSLLEIIAELSAHIDVPEDHIKKGKAVPVSLAGESRTVEWPSLVRIHSGKKRPSETYTSALYRDTWFWIDDNDMPSKRTLSLLMMLLTLTEADEKSVAPVVTIPTG